MCIRDRRDLDPDAFRLLFQTLISGTWIGRIADLGDMALAMARGAEGLPLALIALQWVAVVLWLAAERMVFERRLRRIAECDRGPDRG